jgi:predicted nucleic-acid-binding Zn-ribbon protein
MLKSGTCPKCDSEEVYSGASVPLKKGPFGSNAIPISLTSIAALDNFVCTTCGYTESYVSEADKLSEISKKWSKVNAAESSAAESADP